MNSPINSQVQRSRWVMTLNNYTEGFDYKIHFGNVSYKTRRAVVGKERGANGVPHLQGYIEFDRSYRIGHCKKILTGAYWDAARESALINYRYCTKNDDFFTIGDFSREAAGLNSDSVRNCTVPLLLKGLLEKRTASQVKVSKDYFDRHQCFDKVTYMIKSLMKSEELFIKWRSRKLFIWQYTCLKMIMEQPERKIIWINDMEGNYGKSFLAQYLSVLYGFQMIDGGISCRDAAFFITDEAKGFCFDVSRSSMKQFDYSTLECLKNGVIMSGKYAGKVKRFNIAPVVVFANFHPDYASLSTDRWDVYTLGMAPFLDMSKDSIISPQDNYRFVPPPPVPDLSEDFDLREFLETQLQSTVNEGNSRMNSRSNEDNGSAGPSSDNVTNIVLDETLPSQSPGLQFRQPIQLNHVRPANCPHSNKDVKSKGCNCLKKSSNPSHQVSTAMPLLTELSSHSDSDVGDRMANIKMLSDYPMDHIVLPHRSSVR